MRVRAKESAEPLFLGIECGGTRTVALLVDARLRLLQRVVAGPANMRLLSEPELVRHLRSLAHAFPRPAAVGIGMAGVREGADRARVVKLAEKVWPGIPCYANHDLETALAAAEIGSRVAAVPRVIVLSGTGSCCYGRTPAGQTAKVGGWGHLLGDKGSGYEIGLRALKAVVYYYDRDGVWSRLGQRILAVRQLNEPNDLIQWAQTAGKKEIAALAVEVFRAWAKQDRIAADILAGAADSLAQDAVACAARLVERGAPVQFVLAGSVLLKQPRFAGRVGRGIRRLWPKATITPLKREGGWGAVALARRFFDDLRSARGGTQGRGLAGMNPPFGVPASTGPRVPGRLKAGLQTGSVRRRQVDQLEVRKDVGGASPFGLEELQRSPTEQRNPRSMKLDKLPLLAAIDLILREEARVPRAVLAERKKIERAIRWIAGAFRRGGRLFYVGAGTSGRLGVLDASECPPTFRTPPELVQGIIAGGHRALWESVEGAEDDAGAGADAVRFRGVRGRDVVAGIAASGRTPFVWGALREAQRAGARTILITFNPRVEIPRGMRPALVIAPNVGPEVLTGSTRLKAGTATKLILNLLTTLAMVRTGKVISNLMVDLDCRNAKLRDRAVRIVRALTGADRATAQAALEQSNWLIRKAWQRVVRR
ncbi:MAG: N-acetylmuramic acid 6-phosphate etherase [Limisphaerales bacterium]